jgi:hypothetical protein
MVEYMTSGALMHPDHEDYSNFANNLEYYESFYKESYGATIKRQGDVFYVEKSDRESKFSQNMLLLMAALLNGIEGNGEANAAEIIMEKRFTASEVNSYTRKSAHFRKAIGDLAFGQGAFGLTKLANKGIIRITDSTTDEFKFTPAVNLFFSYFEDLIDHAESLSNGYTEA